MTVPTIVGYSRTAEAGDVLIWRLPADEPGPPGSTLHADGYDEHGRPIRAWWAYAWHSGPVGPPTPYVVRGYVIDDGTGSSVDVPVSRGATPLDWYVPAAPDST